MVSEVPRPVTVMSMSSVHPWKPATMGMAPRSSSRRMRAVSISRMWALVWKALVTIPAWNPVRAVAS